jgi:hypothetical protein
MLVIDTKEKREIRQWTFDKAKIERQPTRKMQAWLQDKLGYPTDYDPKDFCDKDN